MSEDVKNVNDDGPSNFVRERVQKELEEGKNDGRLVTRFPPEPNGYLHIGHAKSITLNFGLAELRDHGVCHLRFDDTNPVKENTEFVESIKNDVRWLGYDWGDNEFYTSDYFDELYSLAETLIQEGKAYVDSQNEEEIRDTRGNFHKPGVNSPFRERSIEENLDLFRRMKAGEFDEGAHVLRAKIDMSHKDVKLRDPLMYRILKAHHHRTGDKWCIYPMYDWAHGQSDAIEKITHSVCTLEFLNHHGLYDWFVEACQFDPRPEQIEFARLNLSYTVLSKRKLQQLVEKDVVDGWDDPRMPTVAGMRRRGYTPSAIKTFCERIGVSKRDGVVDVSLLEWALREDLNESSVRRMAVLDPVKLVIENYPEDQEDEFEVDNLPGNPEAGRRKVPFTRQLWVERDDFMEDAPKKWWRLAIGKEVRLRGAAYVTCTEAIKNDAGEITELRCTWDPESRGGRTEDGRKVRGTIHWVSAKHAIDANVRLYDRLFKSEEPGGEEGNFIDDLNEDSVKTLNGCKLEPSLADFEPGERMQFERLGYFCVDQDSTSDARLFNRTITLKDSWAKLAKKLGKK